MFETTIRILRIMIGLLPIAWLIGDYMLEKRNKGKTFVFGLSFLMFMFGCCACLATGIDAILN